MFVRALYESEVGAHIMSLLLSLLSSAYPLLLPSQLFRPVNVSEGLCGPPLSIFLVLGLNCLLPGHCGNGNLIP